MAILAKLKQAGRTHLSLMRPSRTAWYVGWVGHHNLGDEALYEAIGQASRPLKLIHTPSEGMLRTAARLGLGRKYAVAMLGGGTLIGENTCVDRFVRALDACRHGVVFGTGVEDPAFWATQTPGRFDLPRWKDVLSRCAMVAVRGPRSQAFLAEIGVPSEVIGDPACLFARPGLTPAREKSLGINVGIGSGAMWGDEKAVFDVLARFGRKAIAEGWRVTLHVVWPKDLRISQDLARELGLGAADVRQDYDHAGGFIEAVRKHRVFVGLKLHAVVLAYCAGVPGFMIEYRPKCRDFMASIGAERFLCRGDALTLDTLVDGVGTLDADAEAILGETMPRLLDYRARILETGKRVVELAQRT